MKMQCGYENKLSVLKTPFLHLLPLYYGSFVTLSTLKIWSSLRDCLKGERKKNLGSKPISLNVSAFSNL
jgi:hypothetical protein